MGIFQTNDIQSIVLFLMTIISYIFIFVFAIQNRRLRNKYLQLVKGQNINNLESVILGLQQQIHELQQTLSNHHTFTDELAEKVKQMKANLYIHRYSAFSEETSGLSYSVVWLDDYDNGVVITGLYNREQSYTYAKPIERGQSKYRLSPEELTAIEQTILNREILSRKYKE